MQKLPPSAVKRVAEVVMFENWLRFYFIVEKGEALILSLPEKALEQIKKRYAAFYDMAEYLNNSEIDHQNSLKAVCMHVAAFPNNPLPESVLSQVFDSAEFQTELQLFSSWVQGHEEQLDERFMEFSDWQTTFEEWKNSPDVQAQAEKLKQSFGLATAETSETLQ